MAIVIEANYSKKLGLPHYSSHQFSVTLRIEIADLAQVQPESARLYKLLQEGVDASIKNAGYLPTNNGNGNGNGNGNTRNGQGNGSARSNVPQNGNGNRDVWNCSPKQRQYIIDLVDQNRLDKTAVEQLAQDRFGKSVRSLNKLEASGLIEELKEQVAGNGQANGQQNGRAMQPAATR